jgi:colanic acid biosynthesis glycosyl transferase WcaI
MKFLILTQYYPPEVGAAQTRLSALAQELVNQGHNTEVVTAFPNYPTGEVFPEYRNRWFHSEKIDGVTVYRTWVYASSGVGVRRVLNYGSFLATSLLGLYKASRPDWIFVESPPPCLALSAILASRVWGVPVIVNVADLWPDAICALGLMQDGFFLRRLEGLERFVYRRARFINAVTEGIRSRLIKAKGVAPDKVTFLPNGVDTDLYRPLPSDEGLLEELGLYGKRIVLYAGTHGYVHGLEHVLESARILRSEGIHFLFVGDGSEKPRLLRRSQELRLKNVTFLNPVPPSQIPRYCSISVCGLVTQRKVPLFEVNRPAKTFPMMACAKPIVFSGEGEGARLVAQARAGLVVTSEDPPALASAIRKISENAPLAQELGHNGRKFVQANLTWCALVPEWLEQLRVRDQSGISFLAEKTPSQRHKTR